MRPVLLLAGSAEARALARALAPGGETAQALRVAVTAALAGVTRAPLPHAVPTRVGGFGGAAGLADWLRDHRVAAVIDATHPFAARMAAHAAAACAETGVPRVKLWRPGAAAPGVADLAAAARAIPPGARVFLATGAGDIGAFAARPDLTCHLRLLTPRGDLPGHIRAIEAPPGADVAAEAALLAGLGITHLVARDSGGPGQAKLAAAAALGVQVVLIARPAPPPGPLVPDVAGALAWLATALTPAA